jgi:hypothetical protein
MKPVVASSSASLIPFVAIAALALCAVIATKAQADGDLFFSKPDATDRCKASHASDDRRCRAVRADFRQRSPSRTRP